MDNFSFTKYQIAVILIVITSLILGLGFAYNKGKNDVEIVQNASMIDSKLSNFNPKKGDVVFHITGAVNSPGLYSLPKGSRIYEALKVAGNASQDADLDKINLAKQIDDGEKIDVPFKDRQANNKNDNSINSAVITGVINQSSDTTQNYISKNNKNQNIPQNFNKSQPSLSSKININTASQSELESLPGIGPAYAKRIIEYRNMSGGFKSLEQIMEIKGIGQKTYEKLRPYITL
ncbi:MAG: helix-hairpin-helix domain-containing protein [Armatimonadota bacterium]